MSVLKACERETVLTVADDEAAWTVFTDSTRRTKRILRIAARWGVTPQRCGVGWEFTLPLAAVRFVGPTSARRLAANRAALQNRRIRAKLAPVGVSAEGSGADGVS